MSATMPTFDAAARTADVYVKPQPVEAPVARSRFTVSYARHAATAAVDFAPVPVTSSAPVRADLPLQKAVVEMHKQDELVAFILKHEKASITTESDRRLSSVMLLNAAAQHDIDEARREAYPQQVVDFMRQTWVAFIAQAKEFYQADAEQPCTAELSRTALENISSIGVWFTGPHISVPLRRYTVQLVGSDGTPQNITAVGLLSFAYSSYVMQLRSMSQQSTLESLTRMQEELGTESLFLPPLLVAQS